MKISKQLFFLFTALLIASCSSWPTPISQPTSLSSNSTPTQQTTPFLDFDNPRLHEIAGNKPLVIDEIVRANNQDQEYVAVIVETNDPIYKQEMLVFKIADNTSTLIYDLGPFYYISFNVENEPDPNWLYNDWRLKGSYGFIYFNESPLMLPVLTSMGGNCYDCTGMNLIDITDKGKATDITPTTNFNPKGFVDVNEQGRFEVVATRYYEFDYGACDHTTSPFAFRLFKWQDSAYIDISENEKEFYDQKITELTINLQKKWSKPLHSCWVMPTLANIFFNYESSGRVNEGWEQIKSLGDLSHWNVKNTPPEEIKIYHDVFLELEQRKNKDNITPTP